MAFSARASPTLQVVFGALGFRDIDIGADIALELTGPVEAGNALAAQPAQAQLRMVHPHDPLETVASGEGALVSVVEDAAIVRMQQAAPGVGDGVVGLDPEEGPETSVYEGDAGVLVAHPDQGGRAVGDGPEAGFRFLQAGLRLADVGDVEGHAHEADDLFAVPEAGSGEGLQPAVFAVVTQIPRLHGEGLAGGLAGEGLLQHPLLVVRMDDGAPVQQPRFLVGPSAVGDIGLVGEGAGPILPGHPDQHGGRVGDGAEPLLAFPDLGLGPGAFDLAPGSRGDILDQLHLLVRPVPDAGIVGVEKGAQTPAADQGRAHQRAGLQPLEQFGGSPGAGILADIGNADRPPGGEIGDQVGSEFLE